MNDRIIYTNKSSKEEIEEELNKLLSRFLRELQYKKIDILKKLD